MKLETQEIGRAQISRQEVSKIIAEWAEKVHNLKVKKLVYQDHNEGVVLEVFREAPTNEIPSFPDKKEPVVKGPQEVSPKRPNRGIFDTLNGYFKDLRKKNYVEISFNEVFEDLKKDYPMLDKPHLEMYLWDKRHLKNVRYKSSTGVIKF
jgi:hypothetical protein